jgi:hypothetical protein
MTLPSRRFQSRRSAICACLSCGFIRPRASVKALPLPVHAGVTAGGCFGLVLQLRHGAALSPTGGRGKGGDPQRARFGQDVAQDGGGIRPEKGQSVGRPGRHDRTRGNARAGHGARVDLRTPRRCGRRCGGRFPLARRGAGANDGGMTAFQVAEGERHAADGMGMALGQRAAAVVDQPAPSAQTDLPDVPPAKSAVRRFAPLLGEKSPCSGAAIPDRPAGGDVAEWSKAHPC